MGRKQRDLRLPYRVECDTTILQDCLCASTRAGLHAVTTAPSRHRPPPKHAPVMLTVPANRKSRPHTPGLTRQQGPSVDTMLECAATLRARATTQPPHAQDTQQSHLHTPLAHVAAAGCDCSNPPAQTTTHKQAASGGETLRRYVT